VRGTVDVTRKVILFSVILTLIVYFFGMDVVRWPLWALFLLLVGSATIAWVIDYLWG